MASPIKYQRAEDDQRGLIPIAIGAAKAAILTPIRPLVSRPALRAYLTTILSIIAAFALLGLAVTAYILFYWSYIPRIGFERTIHLQFDNVYAPHTTLARHAHPYPYGIISLAPDIVAQQGYDVWVELTMPRTVDNQEAGNFMLNVEMFGPDGNGKGKARTSTSANILAPLRADIGSVFSNTDSSTVVATSRRPAILPYRSWWVDLLHKLTELHWYILGVRSEDSKLRVPVFERVTFPRGSKNIPSSLRLEIQSTNRLQIYSAKAVFRARFRGIRWFMYNHRIISAIFFISTFWFTEVVFAGLAWVAVSLLLSKGRQIEQDHQAGDLHEAATKIKKEIDNDEDDETAPVLSDTERTFPTRSGQPPLRYTSPQPVIKNEPGTEEAAMVPEAVVNGMEADVEDEDEEDVDFFDSGIGTSLESSGPARTESMRRRRGRGAPGTLTPGSSQSSTTKGGGEE